MGWNSLVVIANLVIVEGADDGVFVYAGTPGLGTLIVSIAAAAGVDAFGNAYPQGLDVTMGTISGTAITGGTITGATVVVDSATGGFFCYSGVPAAGNLVVAIAAAAGVDAFGNVYAEGLNVEAGLLAIKETTYVTLPPLPPAGFLSVFGLTDGSVRVLDHGGAYAFVCNGFAQSSGFSASVVNSTAETVIASCMVPALQSHAPASNNVYRLQAGGDISTNATPGTVVVRLRYGGVAGTNIATMGAVTPTASQANIGISFDALVNIVDADDGSNTADITAYCTTASAALGGARISRNPSTPWAPVSVNDTAAKQLVLTWQWFVAHTDNDLEVYFSQSNQVA